MRFVVDANLSPTLIPILTAAGHDAVHVADVGLLTATDAVILGYARTDGRVVITADSDFPMMLALSGAAGPSVVQLRHVNELSSSEVADLLTANVSNVSEALDRGAIVSLSPRRMAVRPLPIR